MTSIFMILKECEIHLHVSRGHFKNPVFFLLLTGVQRLALRGVD